MLYICIFINKFDLNQATSVSHNFYLHQNTNTPYYSSSKSLTLSHSLFLSSPPALSIYSPSPFSHLHSPTNPYTIKCTRILPHTHSLYNTFFCTHNHLRTQYLVKQAWKISAFRHTLRQTDNVFHYLSGPTNSTTGWQSRSFSSVPL